MVFKEYKNRYGKSLVIDEVMLNSFLAMKDGLDAVGIDLEMVCGWRGMADQEKAFKEGNSRAHFGTSPHNFGVAFDCVPVINGKPTWTDDVTIWQEIGKIGKSIGLEWGGEFKSIVDYPHFQLKGWQSMNLKLYEEQPPLTA